MIKETTLASLKEIVESIVYLDHQLQDLIYYLDNNTIKVYNKTYDDMKYTIKEAREYLDNIREMMDRSYKEVNKLPQKKEVI